MTGIKLEDNDLSGWDFAGQNLTNARFSGAILTGADLSGADTRGAFISDFSGAIVTNLITADGTINGLNLSGGQRLLIRDNDAPHAPPFSFNFPVTIAQQFNLEAGGELQLLFEADPWDSTISFEPGIQVSLEGILNLEFASDVDLDSQLGRTLDLFDWTGVAPAGVFSVKSSYLWDLSQLYSTGEVTFLAVPEPSAAMICLVFAGLGVSSGKRGKRTSSIAGRRT